MSNAEPAVPSLEEQIRRIAREEYAAIKESEELELAEERVAQYAARVALSEKRTRRLQEQRQAV